MQYASTHPPAATTRHAPYVSTLNRDVQFRVSRVLLMTAVSPFFSTFAAELEKQCLSEATATLHLKAKTSNPSR